MNPKNKIIINMRLITAVVLAIFLLVTPLYAGTQSGAASFMPWSGYWWPLNLGELVRGYQGNPSPIEKYDLFTVGYYPGIATSKAASDWYYPDVPSWHGLCHGWANASILEELNFKPSAAHGVFLSVGDKKGLLTACHGEDETQFEYCWHSPEPFHRYLLTYIGEQGMGVAADLDASDEFWSYPIYRYEMKIVNGVEHDQVECRIWHADDLGFSPDFEGTVEVAKTYNYNLEKDSEGNYIKGGGSWQGLSVEDHPDIVWIPISMRPERLFIDYETVKAMASSSDDEFEGMEMGPGHHLLMVYPEERDNFTFEPRPGEVITVNVALDPQSTIGNQARVVLEKNGETVLDERLDRNLREFQIASPTGSDFYNLSFLPDDENTTGCSIHLYADYDAPFQQWFYGYPSARFWLGCAGLLENRGRIAVQVVGNNGLPAQSGEVFELHENGRLLTALSTSDTVDYFRDNKSLAVKFSSVEPLTALCFAGDNQRFWGSVQKTRHQEKKLVIPWLTSRYNSEVRGELFLAQQSSVANQLNINYYKDDGSHYRQQELTFPANKIVEYDEGRYPDSISLNGWALLEAAEEGLDGAVLRSEGNFLKDQLPLLGIASEWMVPHLAVSSGWQTKISLYNPNEVSIAVTLGCKCKGSESEESQVEIAPFAHQEIVVAGDLWGLSEDRIDGAWLNLKSEHEFAGYFNYRYGSDASASLPLLTPESDSLRCLPHMICDEYWWTGLVLVNQAAEVQKVFLTALAEDGSELERVELNISSKEKYCGLADALFTPQTRAEISSLRLEQASRIAAIAIYGTMSGANRISAFCW